MLTNDFIVVDINVEEIIETYAIIDAYSQGKLNDSSTFTARNMGKNDLWIAATASALDLTLITMDEDFNHLKDNYIKLNTINRNTL